MKSSQKLIELLNGTWLLPSIIKSIRPLKASSYDKYSFGPRVFVEHTTTEQIDFQTFEEAKQYAKDLAKLVNVQLTTQDNEPTK